MRPPAILLYAALHRLIASAAAKNSLFALEVTEGEEPGEYGIAFSYKSSVSGQGELKRTADSSRIVYSLQAGGRIGAQELAIDAKLELLPVVAGYLLKCEAKLHSSAGVTAVYLLQARRLNECPHLLLSHNLTTVPDSVLFFSSTLKETCQAENGSRLAIEIDLNSSFSQLLRTHLQQEFVFSAGSGWESMNCTNPVMDITVNADWTGSKTRYRHKKTAVFRSKIFHWIPSFSLDYENDAGRIVVTILQELHDTVAGKRDEL